MIHNYKKISSIKDFKKTEAQLGILERKTPLEAELFFQKLYKFSFSTVGSVSQCRAKEDIQELLNDKIPKDIQLHPFYKKWIIDMSEICLIFCALQEKENISFWLGTNRGCKRFHVDMVPFRLLVTYAGKGTELLLNYGADRNAFINGKPNEEIVKDKSAIKFINKWDIAVFRGGDKGILHRTPNSALDKCSSVLMRLDDSSFLKKIVDINVTA